MKRLNRELIKNGLLTIFLSLLMVIYGLSQVSISGRVIDVETRVPISDVTIFLDATPVGETQSDGRFTSRTVQPGSYLLSAVKPGYYRYTYNLEILNWNNKSPDYGLTLVLNGEYIDSDHYVIGGVRDKRTGKFITNATILLEGRRAVTTDLEGKYFTGMVPVGNRNITISAPGYKTYSRVIPVRNDRYTNFTVDLEPTSINPPITFNVSGTYTTNFRNMTLVQSGNLVTGSYDWDGGKIEGILNGYILTGTWREDGGQSGDFKFTFTKGFREFNGVWREGSSGDWENEPWNGRKMPFN